MNADAVGCFPIAGGVKRGSRAQWFRGAFAVYMQRGRISRCGDAPRRQ
jgi:hypothetical protein